MLRALRRRILTPHIRETRLETRGFHIKNAEAKQQLETVGATFLQGYAYAVEARSATQTHQWLQTVPRAYRGFAYEGAGMGAVMLDSLLGTTKRLDGLLAGEGADHIYMVYVGVGWAMARLPKFLWPDISGYDPLLRWLILDGYGFHQAYFRTDAYVRDPHTAHPFSWAAEPAWYNRHAIDQGIGRALWFVGGTCPDTVASLIAAYPEHRHGDLYAGTGLAATYAGSATEAELVRLAAHAGAHRAQLAQGAAFAAEARERARTTVDHTHLAARVLCGGRTPAQAARVCSELMPAGGDEGTVPAYEVWRRRIAAELSAVSLVQEGAAS
jgi:hypothetical protein